MAQNYEKPGAIVKPTAAQMKQALGYVPARAPTSSTPGVTIGGSPTQPSLALNVSLLLDAIGNTRGSVLYRGASAWQALAPGAAGNFLATNGAGVDPSWAPGGGGGGGTPTQYGCPSPGFSPINSNNSGAGFFVGRVIVMPKAATLNSLIIPVFTTNAATVVAPAIYGVTPGTYDIAALLASGPPVTGVVKGLQTLPLAAPLAVTKGQVIWAGVSISVAALATVQGYAQGTVYFTSPATPPNPAAAPTYDGTTASVWVSE